MSTGQRCLNMLIRVAVHMPNEHEFHLIGDIPSDTHLESLVNCNVVTGIWLLTERYPNIADFFEFEKCFFIERQRLIIMQMEAFELAACLKKTLDLLTNCRAKRQLSGLSLHGMACACSLVIQYSDR